LARSDGTFQKGHAFRFQRRIFNKRPENEFVKKQKKFEKLLNSGFREFFKTAGSFFRKARLLPAPIARRNLHLFAYSPKFERNYYKEMNRQ